MVSFSDADGDGIIEECFEEVNPAKLWGDNHCGFIGFRNPLTGEVYDLFFHIAPTIANGRNTNLR